MIAFLHTSEVHIDRFENLVRKYNPRIQTQHFVNTEILNYALENKQVNTSAFQQEIINIKKEKPALIICTCSTYGELCNETNEVKRIDFPVVDYLVHNYTKIALVFTAKSTEKVSRNLLENIANEQQKDIEIITCDCSEAWVHFEKNNINTYETVIADKVAEIADKVEVIFLAQASMEGAKKHLQNIEPAILTSPEFGIKSYLNR